MPAPPLELGARTRPSRGIREHIELGIRDLVLADPEVAQGDFFENLVVLVVGHPRDTLDLHEPREVPALELAAAHVDGALDLFQIEAVGDQVDLAVFEGAGRFCRLDQPQEHRLGIGRQLGLDMVGEGLNVELALDHQAATAGRALSNGSVKLNAGVNQATDGFEFLFIV